MRIAAIDIGSNAARLLISEVQETKDGQVVLNKLNLVRVPLRLGLDVFDKGIISEERCLMMLETMKAYRALINAYQVSLFKAYATSAMRDAKNSKQIMEKVKEETGINIEIISGDKEASVINFNHIAEYQDKSKAYLYIDVGGGSTELTYYNEGKVFYKESFNIGTIRILKGQVTKKDWSQLRNKLAKNVLKTKTIIAIGSGGNINKIFSMSKKKDGKPLGFGLLKRFYKTLGPLSVEERIQEFKLKEDRADVIVPALQIYLFIMRVVGAKEIIVPKIGLADGIVQSLYEEYKAGLGKGK